MSNEDDPRSERMLLPLTAPEPEMASLMVAASPKSGRLITRHLSASRRSFGTPCSTGSNESFADNELRPSRNSRLRESVSRAQYHREHPRPSGASSDQIRWPTTRHVSDRRTRGRSGL